MPVRRQTPRRASPAASFRSKLALEGPCGSIPLRSAPRIPAVAAVLAGAAALLRFHKRSKAPEPTHPAAAAEPVFHPGLSRPLPARLAVRSLQTAFLSAPRLPPTPPALVVPVVESHHPAA